MDKENKIILGLVVFSLIIFIISSIIGLVTFINIIFVILIGFVFVIYFFVMRYMAEIDRVKFEKKKEQKRNFAYCWRRINCLLDQMPGMEGVRWNNGQEVFSQKRIYSVGDKNNEYRAFVAMTENNCFVQVIYDIDGDDIVLYNDNLHNLVFDDSFYGFKPSENSGSMNSFQNPYIGKKGISKFNYQDERGYGGVNVNLGQSNNNNYEEEKKKRNADKIREALN